MAKLPPMKLAIVAHPASGKDTVADYLSEHYGFFNFSPGDLVRKYVRENNLGEPKRPLLRETGNYLREKNGADYFVREGLKQKADHLVISGVRNIADARTLKEAGGKLIAVNASIQQRYEWATRRARIGDHITFEEFKDHQEKEENEENLHGMHVSSVMEKADYVIENDGTLEELYKKIDDLLVKISKESSGKAS